MLYVLEEYQLPGNNDIEPIEPKESEGEIILMEIEEENNEDAQSVDDALSTTLSFRLYYA